MDVVAVTDSQPEAQATPEVTEEATRIAAEAQTEQAQIAADAAVEQTRLATEAATEQARIAADTSAEISQASTMQAELESRISTLEAVTLERHEAVCDAIAELTGAETMEQAATESGAIEVEKTEPSEKPDEKTDEQLAPPKWGILKTIFLGRRRR